MGQLDLFAVTPRVPFREELKAGLNPQLGAGNPFAVGHGALLAFLAYELRVVAAVISDVKAVEGDGVESGLARARDGGRKVLVGLAPIPHRAIGRHVLATANLR